MARALKKENVGQYKNQDHADAILFLQCFSCKVRIIKCDMLQNKRALLIQILCSISFFWFPTNSNGLNEPLGF